MSRVSGASTVDMALIVPRAVVDLLVRVANVDDLGTMRPSEHRQHDFTTALCFIKENQIRVDAWPGLRPDLQDHVG